jgi:hypothetical protein
VVGRPGLAADCDCVDLLSVPLSAGAEETPGDVVVRHITFNPRALSTTTTTSFLVITGLTSPLTNHYLPVIAPISSYPASLPPFTNNTLFAALLLPALRALRCSAHTYTQPAVRNGH